MKLSIKQTLVAGMTAMLLSPLAQGATVSLASPPQGSVWNTMSNSIANLVRSEAGSNAVVQPFSGNRAMMDAVDQGLAEFAINDVNDAIVAFNGSEDYEDRPRQNLRLAMRISPQPIGIFVRRDAGIDSLEDLRGKRVAAGWNAFPLGRPHMSAMLGTAGLTWADVREVPVPDLIRAADALSSGRIDATYFAAGGPKVAEVDAAVGGVKFLPVPTGDAAQAALDAVRPAFYIKEVAPAPHIAGVDAPVAMVTWDNVLLVGAHVSDDQVYQIVKTVHQNKAALSELFPGFRAMEPDAAATGYPAIDYHPSAIRYYREAGLWQD